MARSGEAGTELDEVEEYCQWHNLGHRPHQIISRPLCLEGFDKKQRLCQIHP